MTSVQVQDEIVTRATQTAPPAVLVYRSELLQPSETFVLSQACALQKFDPYLVGRRKVDGLVLPEDHVRLLDTSSVLGAAKEAGYRLAGFAPGLLKELRELKPVLIHSHFGPDAVPGLRLARKLHVPLVVTYHGYDATMKDEYAREFSFDYRQYLRWKKKVQQEASLFIAVSEFIKGRLIAQGFPQDKIVVHYVGVDTSLFTADPRVEREPIVLFVGRLFDNKGCEYLVRAMAVAQRRVPEARLVVIGDGPLRGELETLAAELTTGTKFLGVQPHATVREWMNRASLFSVPSVTTESGTSEGFGLVFTEAQAMGVPVVSFATGGIPEAVEHGATGLLCGERDVECLAANIEQLLTDDAKWSSFSKAAARRVRSRFDLRAQTAKLEDIYESLLANPYRPSVSKTTIASVLQNS